MNNIRPLRQKANLTLEALASRAGLSVQQLSRLERGDRRLTHEYIIQLAGALGTHPGALLLAPERGEFVDDPDELALLWLWRVVPKEQRELMLRMVTPLNRKVNNAA